MLRELLAPLEEADLVPVPLIGEKGTHGHRCQEGHHSVHWVINPELNLGEFLLEKDEASEYPLHDRLQDHYS